MANIVKRAFQLAARGMDFGGYEGVGPGVSMDPYGGGSWYGIPGAEFDYRTEAGNPWDNSVVAIALSWMWERFPQAEPLIEYRKRDNSWEVQPNHPGLRLLKKPNPYYDSELAWGGFLLGDSMSGNSYFYMNPSRSGRPAELYSLPYFQVAPKWLTDSGNFIDYYEFQPLGKQARPFDVKNIVHARHGVDPINSRLGFSRAARLLRQICADNTTATAAAALMRNVGLLGLLVSTTEADDQITPDDVDKLVKIGKSKLSGERRGEPWFSNRPWKVDQIGYSPREMSFNDVVQVPEERIASMFGIPVVVLQLHAGLQNSTYNNISEAKREAYEGGLCTRWDRLGKALTNQYLTRFDEDPERYRVRFDYSQVPALQENVNEKHKRSLQAWLGGTITLNEYRLETGRQPIPDPEGELRNPRISELKDDKSDDKPKK